MSRILVVDDEPGLRAFLKGALAPVGHIVDAVGDGDDALVALSRQAYDLVLTDLRMPRMDGVSLLRVIKRDQPEVEVVVLTAWGNVEGAVEAMRAGAFDYLQKPISSPEELRLVVGRALERRRLMDARAVQRSDGLPPLAWAAQAMQPVVRAVQKVAPTETTVLLTGESGTGKEVVARTIHAWSRRAGGPFVAVNCAALSEELLSSELFGHEKGSFTGAVARHRGRIELAAGGTFFLDELGEMKASLQARLLRVLESRTFERIGGSQLLQAEVRWVAATNRNLAAMVREGRFREDLYHRLAVFPVHLPPLRERREDIPPLARLLLQRIAGTLGRPDLCLSDAAIAVLEAAPWCGNIRELSNSLERAAILTEDSEIQPEDLLLDPMAMAPASPGSPSMEQAERQAIEQALALSDGNRRRAAAHLGIGLRTLYDKLKRYGLG